MRFLPGARRSYGVLPFLVASLALAPRAGAQGAFFTPVIGAYIPSNELATLASGGGQQTFKLDVALDVGARLGLWFGQRVGMQVTGDYSPTTLTWDSAGTVREGNSSTFAGTGRLMFYLIPKTSPISLELSGGVSVNAYSPEKFATKADYTDVGGVVGVTLGLRLGHIIGITINADDNIYKASFTPTSSTGGVSAPTQNDIRLTGGLRFGG
jgi:hypothetical protein